MAYLHRRDARRALTGWFLSSPCAHQVMSSQHHHLHQKNHLELPHHANPPGIGSFEPNPPGIGSFEQVPRGPFDVFPFAAPFSLDCTLRKRPQAPNIFFLQESSQFAPMRATRHRHQRTGTPATTRTSLTGDNLVASSQVLGDAQWRRASSYATSSSESLAAAAGAGTAVLTTPRSHVEHLEGRMGMRSEASSGGGGEIKRSLSSPTDRWASLEGAVSSSPPPQIIEERPRQSTSKSAISQRVPWGWQSGYQVLRTKPTSPLLRT